MRRIVKSGMEIIFHKPRRGKKKKKKKKLLSSIPPPRKIIPCISHYYVGKYSTVTSLGEDISDQIRHKMLKGGPADYGRIGVGLKHGLNRGSKDDLLSGRQAGRLVYSRSPVGD